MSLSVEAERAYKRLYFNKDPRHPNPQLDFTRNEMFVGFEGTVYAISQVGLVTKFYVREPKFDLITHYASFCFDIIDARISRYWHFHKSILPKRDGNIDITEREKMLFAIKEWIEEPRFLEFLVDGKEREVAIMDKMAKQMDMEFEA